MAASIHRRIPDFSVFNDNTYQRRVCSPSASREYFERFHKPLIEELAGGECKSGMCMRVGGRKVLLDVACGHGHELEFFKDERRIKIVGLDLSKKVLREYTKKKVPDAFLVVADVLANPLKKGFADAAIAVNAVIYEPWEMMQTIFNSLKEGAKAVVNFTLLREEEIRDCALGTAAVREIKMDFGGREFRLTALDFSCGHDVGATKTNFIDARIFGPSLKSVETQVHFQSIGNVEGFVQHAGFLIAGHETFRYVHKMRERETEVYILQKPRTPR